MNNTLGAWLQQTREGLGLTQSDLGRLSKLNRAVINKIENNATKAKPETLLAIAQALRIKPETIFRKAGILPPEPENDTKLKQLTYLLSLLNDEDLQDFEDLAKAKLDRQAKKQTKKVTQSREKAKPPALTVLKDQ